LLTSAQFLQLLHEAGVESFAGVPDSLLKDFCAYLSDVVGDRNHIITANEGAAVALIAGRFIATGRPGLVYLQNSGLGNAVNPLMSLAAPEVYGIPMFLLVGWRGEPGLPDEPQHVRQGAVTLPIIRGMGLPFGILPASFTRARRFVLRASRVARDTSGPFVMVVRAGTFERYAGKEPKAIGGAPTREAVIAELLEACPKNAVVVSTTGMISREVFELRERNGESHGRDFLTVGSMGHANQIALGIALDCPDRRVLAIDGDGSFLMHLGSSAITASRKPRNYSHVVLNNGVHDSVGGQPTVALDIDMRALALALGYASAATTADIGEARKRAQDHLRAPGPNFLEVRVAPGHRMDLGRPTTRPLDNRDALMRALGSTP